MYPIPGWLFALFAGGLVAFTTCSPVRAQEQWSLTHDGHQRTFLVHVPAGVSKQKPSPLVFVFHGGGGDGEKIARLTHFDKEADREGFIAVFPDGLYKHWNDGRSPDVSQEHQENIDDVGFIGAIIDTLRKVYAIDACRIFATGISNGGFFSHYLAAKRSDLFSAIAPVSGGIAIPFDKTFRPLHPVSVLIIQGTEDPLVPYNGGGVMGGRHGSFISTDETVHRWVNSNGCMGDQSVERLPDRDPEDGCTEVVSRWTSCTDRTEVELLRIEGGGHTWPGGSQYLPQLLIGKVCRDFDATEEIWKFFQNHPGKLEN
jgi:polyhydroxybutyrate depolymerase